MESAVADLSRPISELNILPDGEQELLTDGFNTTEGPWESPLAMFRVQVAQAPEHVAVVHGERRLTYRELDRRASELAATFSDYARGNDVIAVMLERSERNLIALIACLKAGCAYLAVDPSYPEQRIATLLESSRVCVVVVDAGRPEKLGGYSGPVIVWSDTAQAGKAFEPGEGPVAYVVFTSGSTGVPKGVCGTTKCLGNLISWQRRTIGDGYRSIQFAALGFDVSVQEMLYSACSGGTLYVADEEERSIQAGYASFWSATPSKLLPCRTPD